MENSLRRLLLALPILSAALVGCGGGSAKVGTPPGQSAPISVENPGAPVLTMDPATGGAAPGTGAAPATTPATPGATPPATGTK
jgi:hypothetical protein